MAEKAPVTILTIAILAVLVAAVRAQDPAASQKPPDAKVDAVKEEMPADFTAFNDAGKEKDRAETRRGVREVHRRPSEVRVGSNREEPDPVDAAGNAEGSPAEIPRCGAGAN